MNGRERTSGKKVKKSGRRDDSADGHLSEEIQSALDISSSSSKNVTVDGEEMTYEDKQDEMVEQLSEKRASTRIAALTPLIDQLQTSVLFDFVSDRFDTLEMYLLQSVKKGDTPEVLLATRALALLAVTLGAEADRLVAGATTPLNEYLKNSSKSSHGRAAVAEAIGFITFIGSSNDHDTQLAMSMLDEQLKQHNVPEALASAGWEAWGLMATTLPTHKLAGDLLDSHLPSLVKYLDHESIDVKTAAGECIALLWETKQQVEAERAEAEGEDGAGAAAASEAAAAQALDAELDLLPPLGEAAVPTLASMTSTEEKTADAEPVFDASAILSGSTRSPVIQPRKRPMPKAKSVTSSSTTSHSHSHIIDQAGLIAKLSLLAKDSGRHQSKKVRAAQKRSFREFLRTVEDGDVPDESLKIEKSRHEFSGWPHIIQLDAIRDVCGKGLNTHFVHNETLREIFDLYIESGDGVDDPNRKAASRAQSKAKERENYESRTKNRKKKHALANSFGENED